MSLRLLLVDNYDSFTFNLYQALATLLEVPPIVVTNDADYETVRALDFDAVILSPGPGRPTVERDFGICRRLIEDLDVPILGVCLGHQGIGAAFGARVVHAPEPMHGRSSEVIHWGDLLFDQIPNPFDVIRYHSLVIEDLPDCLEPIAETADGLLMGIRHRTRPIWGVQFHPESIGTPHGNQLLGNFVAYVTAHASRPRPDFVHQGEPLGTPMETTESSWQTVITPLDGWLEPEQLFARRFSKNSAAFWLDSTATGQENARFSYMGDGSGPFAEMLLYHLSEHTIQHSKPSGMVKEQSGFFEYFEREFTSRRLPRQAVPFDFQGGWVGYLGYELKAECGGERKHPSSVPDAALLFCDRVVVFDHETRTMYAVTVTPINQGDLSWIRDLTECQASEQAFGRDESGFGSTFELSRKRSQYLADIESCLHEIREGETYEVCLTTHLVGAAVADPLAFYRDLRSRHAVPFGAYFRVDDLHLASISPERFISVNAEGAVEAKPIKGTAARGETAEADELARRTLASSEKDRAENLMIVDLLRNDLGRECEVGSVSVPVLMDVESYAVHQLVSTVRGRLGAESNGVRLVRSAFPGGSMTGAPKKRTMQIIDHLEGEARGPYSGALGYFSLCGAIDLSIVIRTAVMTPVETRIGVGGAIVALSDPNAEVDEIVLKGQTVLSGFPGAVISPE